MSRIHNTGYWEELLLHVADLHWFYANPAFKLKAAPWFAFIVDTLHFYSIGRPLLTFFSGVRRIINYFFFRLLNVRIQIPWTFSFSGSWDRGPYGVVDANPRFQIIADPDLFYAKY
jgi:hypothetical protein